ncbi:hypothetical protein [Nonomuraea sp. NPDC050643]|uniref:hypothetical protein n=1 Tax=Nonomuraea sp. NPDC050643 TaxID=3155660 RepID=UPI0033F575AF
MTTSIAGWVRPWYPAGLEAHLFADCDELLHKVPEPVEGSGWLDPRADVHPFYTCADCLHRHDPTLAIRLDG